MPETPLASARTSIIALVAVVAVVTFGAMVSVQAATLALAGLAFVGAALRMMLPAGRSFSVRRRAVDVGIMVAFGLALAFLGLTTPLG